MTTDRWTEESSKTYRLLAHIAVPQRAEQIATLLTLLPFDQNQAFRVVELASGEGRLAAAILQSFTQASLLALDISEDMRTQTAQRLNAFGERASVEPFDMQSSDWYPHMENADCVISSLCIHHLTGDEKAALFKAVSQKLSGLGAFLIADLVLPQRQEANELFAATWDRAALQQSMDMGEGETFFEAQFVGTGWNYYKFPDDFDKPSPLIDQLLWLREAGFTSVDCFWMQAGHAIFGGYKSAKIPTYIQRLTFEDALRAAQAALTD